MIRNMRRAPALCVIVFALAACELHACTEVLEWPQMLVRRAAVVVEGIATEKQFEFRIGRTWKGSSHATVRLTGIRPTHTSCDTYKPTVPGTSYILLIASDEALVQGTAATFVGEAEAIPFQDNPPLVTYLTKPLRVSRRDVMGMLRGWRAGTIADDAFARWLHETAPVAEVEDWLSLDEDSPEVSLNLNVIYDLDRRINGRGVGLDELSCELRVLRERVVPAMLRILEIARPTMEILERLAPELDDDIDADTCP